MEGIKLEGSDHDLLVQLATLMNVVRTNQINHLEHHRRHDLIMLSVTLGSVFTSFIAIGCAILSFMN